MSVASNAGGSLKRAFADNPWFVLMLASIGWVAYRQSKGGA